MKISRAFSLVEISIVILIVGVLVAGMTEGSKLFKKSKLRTARAMTKASYAASVEDMILWLDATAEGSMVNVSGLATVQNDEKIQTWNDVNPQVISKYSFVQSTDANRPLYKDNGINGLPTLYFNADGTQTNGNALYSIFTFPSDQITIFVVMRPIVAANNGYIFDAFCSSPSTRIYLLQSPTYKVSLSTNGGGITDGSSATLNKNYVYSATANASSGIIYRNGTQTISGTISHAAFTANFKKKGFIIGAFSNGDSTSNFDGYISEMILYSRVLETEERKEIEKYLGKKYGIQVS